jgi:hypothetical protein
MQVFLHFLKNPLNCPAKENSLNQKIFENLKEWRKNYEKKTINGNKNKLLRFQPSLNFAG